MKYSELKKVVKEICSKLGIVESPDLIMINLDEMSKDNKEFLEAGDFRYEGICKGKNYTLMIPGLDYTNDNKSYLNFLFEQTFKTPEESVFLSKWLRNSCYDYFEVIKKELGSNIELDLYEIVNRIATLNYEKEEAKGRIIFIPLALKEFIKYEIEFEELIDLKEERLIRKLIEISRKDLSLIATPEGFLGFGKLKELEKIVDQKIYIIDFLGINDYEIYIGKVKKEEKESIENLKDQKIKYYMKEELLLKIYHGFPKLENKVTFMVEEILKKEFKGISVESSKKIIKIIENAKGQKKGTLLVFLENALNERKRFSKQAINIKNHENIVSFIDDISSIDGALMFNTKGECCSIGLILDGITTKETGNPSRGARYNSALKYIENRKEKKEKALAVVVSEDGMVDYIYTENSKEKISKWKEEAKTLEELGNIKGAIAKYNRIIKETSTTKYLRKLASLEYNFALSMEDNKKDKKKYLESAKENYKKAGNKLGEANALQWLARILIFKETSKSLELIDKAYDIYKEIKNKNQTAICLLIKGIIIKDQDSLESLRILKQALLEFEEVNDELGKGHTLLYMGEVLEKFNRKEEVLNIYKVSLEIFKKHKSKAEIRILEGKIKRLKV